MMTAPASGSSRKALVLGGTGLIGGYCLRAALDSGLYQQVTSLGRHKAPIVHSRLRQVITDFSNLDELLQDIQAEDVFCCLGTTMKKAGSEDAFRRVDFDYPLQVATLMRRKGASHFLLVSAMGADQGSIFFYNRVKGEIEQALTTLEYPYLSIFRPSLLLGERDESRPLESVSGQILGWMSPFMKGPLTGLKPIAAEKVAGAMLGEARKAAMRARPPGVLIVDSAVMQDVGTNE